MEDIKNQLPITSVIIPDKLTAEIYLHTVSTKQGSAECLAYRTNGLEDVGQNELVLILRSNAEEYDIPETPLYFFAQVYAFAEQGRVVGEGDITQFGEKDLLGWKGVVYMDFPLLAGDEDYKNCLAMVLLTFDEAQSVRQFGYLRVAALLGMENSYYPYPYWSDLDRQPLPVEQIATTSIIPNLGGSVHFPLASVMMENNEIVFTLPKNTPPNKLPAEILPLELTFAIFPGLNKTANGCLVFTANNPAPAAITPEGSNGSRLSGCVLVVGAQQDTNFTRIIEDGFAVMMTNEAWREFWESLIHKKAFALKMDGENMDFAIKWE